MTLVRDANGLPMIPGATIQGLLRRLFRRQAGQAEADNLFGRVDPATGRAHDGRLIVSHALVHGSKDQPLIAFPASDAINRDPVWSELAAHEPLLRDHVRLNHAHVAYDTGKFDRVAVPRGTRFSFELALAGEAGDRVLLQNLVSLVAHPLFRPGGARARGYGRVRVVRAGHGWFGPEDPAALREVREQHPGDLSRLAPLEPKAAPNICIITMRVRPVNPFRVGSTGLPATTGRNGWFGQQPDHAPDRREKPVDAAPVREPWIEWTTGEGGCWHVPSSDPGKRDRSYPAPGSGLRGPLAHRTLFHWNRLSARFAEQEGSAFHRERPPELEPLLGAAKSGNAFAGERGRASSLLVEDALLGGDKDGAPRIFALDHSSIDRLTGGVRATVLFSEELLMPQAIELRLVFDGAPPAADDVKSRKAALSLCHALRDLKEGRLAVGAGSLGFCEGEEPTFGAGSEAWAELWAQTRRTPITLQLDAA